MRVFVVIPAKNEEKTIGEVIRRCKKVLENEGMKHKIIVVDDGSTDGTGSIAKKEGAEVLRHFWSLGKGKSIMDAFVHLLAYERPDTDDVIILIDADLQHLPEDIPKFLKKMKRYDMVIGVRDIGKYPLHKRIGNRAISGAISFILRKKYRDVESGFRTMKWKVVLSLLKTIYGVKKYEIEVCSTVAAHVLGFKIGEVKIASPVYYEGKGTTVKDGIRDAVSGLKTYLALRWRLWLGK